MPIGSNLQAQLELGMAYASAHLRASMFPGTPLPSFSEIKKKLIEDKQWIGVCTYLEKQSRKWLEKGLSTFQFRCSTGMFIWIKNDDSFDEALKAYKERLKQKIEAVQDELRAEISGGDY